MSPPSVATEGKRSENHALWHHQQADVISNNNSISRTQTDGGWLSQTGGSKLMFQDAMDDTKFFSAGTVFSGYSTPNSSKLKNDSMCDHVENVKKTETATSCRIFGIEFFNHSASSPSMEKTPLQPISASTGTTEGRVSNSLAAESDQKSDVSKASKESKPGQLQVSLKETQAKQSCSTSTRSRTKVLKVDFVYVF